VKSAFLNGVLSEEVYVGHRAMSSLEKKVLF
jgi:hypothetical protein